MHCPPSDAVVEASAVSDPVFHSKGGKMASDLASDVARALVVVLVPFRLLFAAPAGRLPLPEAIPAT
jgi:hypothetical protein